LNKIARDMGSPWILVASYGPKPYLTIQCIYECGEVVITALVTVRVSESLKKEMRRVKSVNWSELLRRAIEARIELERLSPRDWDRVRKASGKADALRNEMRRKYGSISYDSAETIRYWRETRSHGTS